MRDAPPDPKWPDDDMLTAAWGLIANASGGDWPKESPDWQAAAAKWRDAYVRAAAPAPTEPSEAAIAAALNVMPHRRMVPFEPYGFGGAPELHPEEVRTALRAAYAVDFSGLPRLEAPQ